ncbi:type II secretion system protein GspK [Acidovorax lacteus]|uniref:type II secretion system protein GspK n=1 Tax=Acidovorax lacteus TaxID=1924988 RepID=UPI0031E81FA4
MLSPAHARGLALIAVLWIVAALSIAASGLVNTARQEIRHTARQHASVQSLATADAAVRLVLRDLVVAPEKPAATRDVEVAWAGQTVAVQVQPLNGLVDLNHAPVPLLAALFQHAGGVPPSAAEALAVALEAYRKRPDAQGRAVGLDAPEDLLQLPGFPFDLYVSIRPLVSTALSGAGLVNALAAPPEVLLALAQGDAAAVQQIVQTRATAGQTTDTTRLNPAFVGNTPSRAYMLTARVPVDSDAELHRVWIVSLAAAGRNGLPWQVIEQYQRLHRPPIR